jgi:hypothetical protein
VDSEQRLGNRATELKETYKRCDFLVQLRVELFEIVTVSAEHIVRQLVQEDASDVVVGAESVQVVGQESQRDLFAGVRVQAEEFLAGRMVRMKYRVQFRPGVRGE